MASTKKAARTIVLRLTEAEADALAEALVHVGKVCMDTYRGETAAVCRELHTHLADSRVLTKLAAARRRRGDR